MIYYPELLKYMNINSDSNIYLIPNLKIRLPLSDKYFLTIFENKIRYFKSAIIRINYIRGKTWQLGFKLLNIKNNNVAFIFHAYIDNDQYSIRYRITNNKNEDYFGEDINLNPSEQFMIKIVREDKLIRCFLNNNEEGLEFFRKLENNDDLHRLSLQAWKEDPSDNVHMDLSQIEIIWE